MNASRFVFDELPAALSHAIFIEWMDSLKDMAALDSACCSHACREILHETWAEMPPCFPQEQMYFSEQHSLLQWLYSRRLHILTTMSIDFTDIPGLLGIHPALRSVSELFLANPPRHNHRSSVLLARSKPTREEFFRFFQGLPNLKSIASEPQHDCPAHIWEHVFKATKHLPIEKVSTGNLLRLPLLFNTHGKTLKFLHLFSCVDSEVLQALSAHCPALQELRIDGDLEESDLVHLTPVSAGLRQLHLRRLRAPLWSLLPHMHNLKIMEVGALGDFAFLPAFLQQCSTLQRFVAINFVELCTNQTGGYDLQLKMKHTPLQPLRDHLHPSVFPKPVQKLTFFECNACTSAEAATLLSHFGDTLLTVKYRHINVPPRDAEFCKPVLQDVFAHCPHLTGLHFSRPIDLEDIPLIGNIYGQQLKALTISLHERLIPPLQEHQGQCLALLIQQCPNLEHLMFRNAEAFPDHMFGSLFQHCPPALSTLQIDRKLSDDMIAELIRWRGHRPLQFLQCYNMRRVAELMRQHHKSAGTINPWTSAGNSWCMCWEQSCVHRRKVLLV